MPPDVAQHGPADDNHDGCFHNNVEDNISVEVACLGSEDDELINDGFMADFGEADWESPDDDGLNQDRQRRGTNASPSLHPLLSPQ